MGIPVARAGVRNVCRYLVERDKIKTWMGILTVYLCHSHWMGSAVGEDLSRRRGAGVFSGE